MHRHTRLGALIATLCLLPAVAGAAERPAAASDPEPLDFESALPLPPGSWQQHVSLGLDAGPHGRGTHLTWRYGWTEALTLAATIGEVHLLPRPAGGDGEPPLVASPAAARWGFGLQALLHGEDALPALAVGLREHAHGHDVQVAGYLAWQRHLGPALLQGDVEMGHDLTGPGQVLAGHLDAAWLLGPAALSVEVEGNSGLDGHIPQARLIPAWRQHVTPGLQLGIGIPVGLTPSSPPVGVLADVVASW